ncbi:MAG: hypothetical protein KBT46_04915 [Ruminococcus sp.]|nr:hypothetical protein [Candidatus Copronaster equi]
MKEDVLFRKKTFGGFDRNDVISYVQNLKRTQQNYKTMLMQKDEANKSLSSENAELKKKLDEANEKCSELEKKITELEKAKGAKSRSDKKAAEKITMCDELVETATKAAQKVEKDAAKKIQKAITKIEKTKDMDSAQVEKMLKKLVEELS